MFLPISVLPPSWTKVFARPPLTWNEKSVAIFVPPESFTTSFLTMSVPGLSSFVIVQVFVSPTAIVPEQSAEYDAA